MAIDKQIQKLTEAELRTKIVIPLLEALGCFDVQDYHGNREEGKDVLYKTRNVYRQEVHGAVVLKQINISKPELTSGSTKSQIDEAIDNPFYSPGSIQNESRISELCIMTSRNITDDAKKYINLQRGRNFPSIYFVNGAHITDLILGIMAEYHNKTQNPEMLYQFDVETFKDFCQKYQSAFIIQKEVGVSAVGSATQPMEGTEVT